MKVLPEHKPSVGEVIREYHILYNIMLAKLDKLLQEETERRSSTSSPVIDPNLVITHIELHCKDC